MPVTLHAESVSSPRVDAVPLHFTLRCSRVERLLRLAAFAATFLLPVSVDADGPKPLTILPGGGQIVFANAVSDTGVIVGTDGVPARALVWTSGTAQPIVLSGQFSAAANGVNDLGQVVGRRDGHAFLWTAEAGFVDLGTLGGSTSEANGVNDQGQVVGVADTAAGASHAFLWSAAGGMVDLGTLGGTSSVARAINNVAQVVGAADTTAGQSHAFVWSLAGGMIDLGSLGGMSSVAQDINASGAAVGYSTFPGDRTQAFIRTAAGGMMDLTQRDDAENSRATAINDSGQVVGRSGDQAFSWTAAGDRVRLVIANPAASEISDINDSGLMVGWRQNVAAFVGVTGLSAVTWQWSWDDVAADFGSAGLWLLGQRGTSWSQVLPLSPTTMARADLDGNGSEDLVASFGAGLGVWVWMNHSTWVQIHNLPAAQIVAGDLDGNGRTDLVLAFPGLGIWSFENQSTWERLHPTVPSLMATGRVTSFAADQLVVGFPGQGVWIRRGSLDWIRIHEQDASVLHVAELLGGVNRGDFSPRAEVVIGFAGAGLWAYNEEGLGGNWRLIHPFDVRRVVTGDFEGRGFLDMVVDFGPQFGLWTVAGLTRWTALHPFSTDGFVAADLDGLGRDELVVNFGLPYGVWADSTLTGWRLLADRFVEGLRTGVFH